MAPSPALRRLRARLGLSQAGLAELLGVHAMTVSKWERGRARPGAHQRRLLAAFREAADRGLRLEPGAARGKKRADQLRTLTEILAQAHGAAEIDLGTLSATNRFAGRIVELARGDVMSKVVIEVAPALRIGAVITTDSVERLGLAVGSRAVAIIKATEVIVGSA